MTRRRRFYGKYRGTVLSVADPELMGRITATVSVGGAPLTVVADACTPYAGPLVGFYAIPPIGAGVWIEFEEGNLDKPIWTGCFWRTGELLAMLSPDLPPPTPATAQGSVVLRCGLTRLKLEMLTGIATLESLAPPATPATPVRVRLSAMGVEVAFSAGGKPNTVWVTPGGVLINNDALVVI